jgi:hypothetical protein
MRDREEPSARPRAEAERDTPGRRKPYVTPKLSAFGTIRKITGHAFGMGTQDGLGGSMIA